MPHHTLHAPVLDWYDTHQRPLPWRDPATTPWGVLVSEVMAQQTPVARVAPVWHEWMTRWPTPADLAAAAPGDAVREWGRLGYPRRALRLHECAGAIVERHGGVVPQDEGELLALPGIGAYTAAAVRAFAFGRRSVVVDTNVRRVEARAVTGTQYPAASLSAAEQRLAASLVPDDDATAARWSVAVMELGAIVCTARAPRCGDCPLVGDCAWVAAGRPEHDGPPRRGQAWAGTDRQVRGRLLQIVRDAHGPVPLADLRAAWPDDDTKRMRCLDGLVADGLLEPLAGDRFALPGHG